MVTTAKAYEWQLAERMSDTRSKITSEVEKSCREAGGSTFSELCGTEYLPACLDDLCCEETAGQEISHFSRCNPALSIVLPGISKSKPDDSPSSSCLCVHSPQDTVPGTQQAWNEQPLSAQQQNQRWSRKDTRLQICKWCRTDILAWVRVSLWYLFTLTLPGRLTLMNKYLSV